MSAEPAATDWWRGAVGYQIYPRSFADANGDGIGDLAGICQRLDHLRSGPASLEVDVVWLSPIFPSPMADYGYDIADYRSIDPQYGTLEEMDALVGACHRRGLRVLLDLVPNHTSVQHPWFVASRSSRHDPHADWYIWADPAPGGGPPNNWRSVFGGSAWTWDARREQFYLHSFYPEQPDLNWRHPPVEAAMHEVMRFWLRRGVDGFRIDAIAHVMKDARLRDNPPAGEVDPRTRIGTAEYQQQEHLWDMHRPEVHEVIAGMRRVCDEFPGAVLVGELYTRAEQLARYLSGPEREQFQLAFNFELLRSDWHPDPLRRAVERAEALLPQGGWPAYALANHDQGRLASRYGERSHLAVTLLLTMRGTPFLYAGDEIGMRDAGPDELPLPLVADRHGRDACRTPMQWEPIPGGGFTSGEPWLPLIDPEQRSVAAQRDDPGSLLSLHRRLIVARHRSVALSRGEHRSIYDVPEPLIAFLREAEHQQVLVLLNFADAPLDADLSRWGSRGQVLFGTHRADGVEVGLRPVALAPLEALVLELRFDG